MASSSDVWAPESESKINFCAMSCAQNAYNKQGLRLHHLKLTHSAVKLS